MGGFLPGAAALAASLAALLIWPSAAAEGVRRGLSLAADSIIPSLFPFFVLSTLAGELGVPQRLARRLSAPMGRLFGLPGTGAAALLAGVLGGYPLGAAATSGLVERGALTPAEGARLLGFANNSGPAFLIGAAGAGVFGSVRAGLALYAAHVLAALSSGLVMRGRGRSVMSTLPEVPRPRPGAFARSVTASVGNILNVCGFVVIFSALVSALEAAGIFTRLAGGLSLASGLELSASRALLTGFFELGGGIGALRGCSPTRTNFALAALIIGWGGLSVHMQTASAARGVPMRRHLAGRILSAALGAAYAAALCPF